MAALDSIKECLAAAGPLEVAKLEKDEATRQERLKLSKKIGFILVCNMCILNISSIYLWIAV
jgi:hypothetical protein